MSKTGDRNIPALRSLGCMSSSVLTSFLQELHVTSPVCCMSFGALHSPLNEGALHLGHSMYRSTLSPAKSKLSTYMAFQRILSLRCNSNLSLALVSSNMPLRLARTGHGNLAQRQSLILSLVQCNRAMQLCKDKIMLASVCTASWSRINFLMFVVLQCLDASFRLS